MKKLFAFLTLLALSLTLCACSPTAPTETDSTQFTARGLTLVIPNEYADMLLVEVPDEIGFYQYIFSVHEKASVEAAQQLWPDDSTMGGGFLFAIGQVDEDGLQELQEIDMTGAQVLATDAQGNYYIYYHPTDVQLLRVEYTDADWEQWMALGGWAVQMKQEFLSQNPHLTPYSPEA